MTTQGQETTIVHHGTNNQMLHLPLEEVWVNAVVVDGKQVDATVTQVVRDCYS